MTTLIEFFEDELPLLPRYVDLTDLYILRFVCREYWRYFNERFRLAFIEAFKRRFNQTIADRFPKGFDLSKIPDSPRILISGNFVQDTLFPVKRHDRYRPCMYIRLQYKTGPKPPVFFTMLEKYYQHPMGSKPVDVLKEINQFYRNILGNNVMFVDLLSLEGFDPNHKFDENNPMFAMNAASLAGSRDPEYCYNFERYEKGGTIGTLAQFTYQRKDFETDPWTKHEAYCDGNTVSFPKHLLRSYQLARIQKNKLEADAFATRIRQYVRVPTEEEEEEEND